MPEREYASKGVGTAGLTLGVIGTALAALDGGPGGILGNLLGGPRPGPQGPLVSQEILNLTAENTLLKSQQYTDHSDTDIRKEICGLKVQQAVQGEQIAANERAAQLREQVMEGKVSLVAQTANSGIQLLQCNLNCLQNTVNQIAKTYVPAGQVTPLPAPYPFPPVGGPYPTPPIPPVPPVNVTINGGTTDSGAATASSNTNG